MRLKGLSSKRRVVKLVKLVYFIGKDTWGWEQVGMVVLCSAHGHRWKRQES
jgi:hypothetical protein